MMEREEKLWETLSALHSFHLIRHFSHLRAIRFFLNSYYENFAFRQ